MSAANVGLLLLRWWWLLFNAVMLSLVLALLWVNQQPEYYQSESSYVLGVRLEDPKNVVRAESTLRSTDQIMETYISIANSDVITDRARSELGLTEIDVAATATSSVVPGTNVMVVAARSADPQLAADMSRTVGQLTEAYVDEVSSVFVLSALDPPTAPEYVGPNTVAALALASSVALVLGVAVAAAIEYQSPSRPLRERLSTIFDRGVPAYSARYVRMRLRAEIKRSADTGETFSVGVLEVIRRRPKNSEDDQVAPVTLSDLDNIATSVGSALHDQDLLAHLGRGRFVAILPGLDLYEAQAVVTEWRKDTTEILLEDDLDRDVVVKVGACEFDKGSFIGDPDAEQIASSL